MTHDGIDADLVLGDQIRRQRYQSVPLLLGGRVLLEVAHQADANPEDVVIPAVDRDVRAGALFFPAGAWLDDAVTGTVAIADHEVIRQPAVTLLGMKRPRLSQLVKQYGLGTGIGDITV